MNDRHDFRDPRYYKSGHDFGQGSYKVLPDNGMCFEANNMRSIGYTLYQDFVNNDDEPVRWWFRDLNAWKSRIERIEQMGHVATDKLMHS